MLTREEILARMQAIADAGETRSLTDDEAAEYGDLEGRLKQMQRTDEIRARQDVWSAPASGPLQVIATGDGRPDDTIDRAFEHYLRTGVENQDIVELRAQGEGTGAAGGYTVPSGFRQKLVDRMLAFGGLASVCESFDTENGEAIEWPTLDDTANTGEIVAEAGTFAAGADLTFGTATLGAYKYASGGAGNKALKVSWELANDSAFDLEGLVARKLGERIARLQATHWISGTGSGQPEGLVYNQTPSEVLNTSATFTYAELVDFVHDVDPAYRDPATCGWIMNDTTWGLISKLVDGNGRPLWEHQAMSGLQGAPRPVLLGYPVTIDQAMASAGSSAKLAAFGDFREGYVIRRVRDIAVVVLRELYAENGQIGYMAWARADGVPQNENAYKVLADAA